MLILLALKVAGVALGGFWIAMVQLVLELIVGSPCFQHSQTKGVSGGMHFARSQKPLTEMADDAIASRVTLLVQSSAILLE